MYIDGDNDQPNIKRKNRFTEWLGQNTHLVSLGQRLPLLQLRRSDYPGLAISAWASRITSPIHNLAGYIYGKFQRASLSGRQADNIHWLSRRKKLHGHEINPERIGYLGESDSRIGSESSTIEYSGYDASDNIISPMGEDPVDRQARTEGFSVFENRRSGDKSSHHDIIPLSINNTKKMSEETGQRAASLGHTQVQSTIREQVESLTENRIYPADIIKNKSEPPYNKQNIRSEVQPSSQPSPVAHPPQKDVIGSTSRYVKDNQDVGTKAYDLPSEDISERDIPDSSKQPEYTTQKELPHLTQSGLPYSQSESASSVDVSEIPSSEQAYTSEAYSPMPPSHPSNVTEGRPDRFAAISAATSAAHKIIGGILGKTGLESKVAILSVTKEAAGSKQRSSHTSTKLPIARLIQTKAAGHVERLTNLPQKMMKNTTNSFIQAHKSSPERDISARGNWPENSLKHSRIDIESAAGDRIIGSETAQQANIPLSHSIYRPEADQDVPSIKGNWPDNSLQHSRIDSETATGKGITGHETAQQVNIPLPYSIHRLEAEQGISAISQPYISERGLGGLSTETERSLPLNVEDSSVGYRKISQVRPSIFKYAPSIGHPGQFLQRSLARITEFSGKRFEVGSEMSPAGESIPPAWTDHSVSPELGKVFGASNSIDSDQIEREHVFIPHRLSSIQGKTLQTQASKYDVGTPVIQMAYPKQRPIDDKHSPFNSDIDSIQRGTLTPGSIPTFLDRRSDGNFMTVMPAIRETGEIGQAEEQPEKANAGIDIDSLAQKVYGIIKRQLSVEMERRGVRF